MSESTNQSAQTPGESNESKNSGNQGEGGQEQTFTQADVDRVVAERLKREREATKQKYADYEDLKKAAEGAKTAEDRIAELEKNYQSAEAARLRSDVAAQHGISAEDRDLFLTGSDEETLTAQAKRLSERESERQKSGNYVPTEGDNQRSASDPKRDFLRSMKGD